MKVKKIVVIVLLSFIVILLVQNVQIVTLRFLFWKISMSRIIFIPLVLIIGFILGYLFAKTRRKK
jgi:putative membrane protein